jgi:hypothetical protein
MDEGLAANEVSTGNEKGPSGFELSAPGQVVCQAVLAPDTEQDRTLPPEA